MEPIPHSVPTFISKFILLLIDHKKTKTIQTVEWLVFRLDDQSSIPNSADFTFATIWGPPSLLSNGHRDFFLGGKAAEAWS
jgi:hypothetical protein